MLFYLHIILCCIFSALNFKLNSKFSRSTLKIVFCAKHFHLVITQKLKMAWSIEEFKNASD